MIMKKIAIVGTHGTGKSIICEKVLSALHRSTFDKMNKQIKFEESISIDILELKALESFYQSERKNKLSKLAFIPEQFREVIKDVPGFRKQTKEITLATYNKQLYLENLYTTQGKSILCDRSVLDTFIYYKYFTRGSVSFQHSNIFYDRENYVEANFSKRERQAYLDMRFGYDKIYLIEPSDRKIEPDGFRLTNKKQQLEIHDLFLRYFDNAEIVNQEEAHKEEFIKKVSDEFEL